MLHETAASIFSSRCPFRVWTPQRLNRYAVSTTITSQLDRIRLKQLASSAATYSAATYRTEILQYILEVAAERASGWQHQISQVCRRRRNVSINTPKLWTYIEYSMPKGEALIELFWSRMRERSMPQSPRFSYVGCTGSHHWHRSFPLDAFPYIKRVTLNFATKAAPITLNGNLVKG